MLTPLKKQRTCCDDDGAYSPSRTPNPEGVTELRFIQWMRDQGCWVHPGLYFRTFRGTGRGVACSENLEIGDRLFTLPFHVRLSIDTSDLSKRAHLRHFSCWTQLILVLMYEMLSVSSRWRPYLDVLPKRFHTPLFWSPLELNGLIGTSTLRLLGKKQIDRTFAQDVWPFLCDSPSLFPLEQLGVYFGGPDLSNDWGNDGDDVDHLLSSLHGPTKLPFTKYKLLFRRLFLNVGTLIQAYSFCGDQGDIYMTPMADMLNHKTGHNNARLFTPTPPASPSSASESESHIELDAPRTVQMVVPPGDVDGHPQQPCEVMRAIRRVPAHSELFNTYGDLPNSCLLRKYGFVDIPNPHDIAEISVETLIRAVRGTSSDGGAERSSSSISSCTAGQAASCCSSTAAMHARISALIHLGVVSEVEDGAGCIVLGSSNGGATLPHELWTTVRALCLPQTRWMELAGQLEDWVDGVPPSKSFPHREHVAVAIALRETLHHGYPTTMEEDHARWKRWEVQGIPLEEGVCLIPTKQRRAYSALAVAMGEKRILSRALESVERAIQAFQKERGEEDQENQCKRDWQSLWSFSKDDEIEWVIDEDEDDDDDDVDEWEV